MVCVCHVCVVTCFYKSIVLFKQEYGGGTRRRGIHFIKKKTIPQCHWFLFGTVLHNNTALTLACTIMNVKDFHCVFFNLPVGMFSSHTNAFLFACLLFIRFHHCNLLLSFGHVYVVYTLHSWNPLLQYCWIVGTGLKWFIGVLAYC